MRCALLERIREQPGGEPLLAAAYEGVHLVGGAVRDLLRGERPRELDVVVEGEIERLLQRLGGKAVIHDRFGTASVSLGGARIDIVRARRERYPRPGALPEVEPATVAEDLLRRDFTVNAMAVSLDGGQGGELQIVDHAQEDLAAGRLRVLHERSFLDDPTRLLRLARYAARLDFELEERTAELALEALAAGTLKTVSGARVGAELRLALAELDPIATFGRLDDLGVLAALHPRLRLERPLAEGALAALPDDGRPDLLLLACLLLSAARADEDPERAMLELLDDLEFTAGDRDRVIRTVLTGPALVERLESIETPSQLREAVRAATLEAVALAVALAEQQRLPKAAAAARRWLSGLRHVRLRITGDDLLAAGIAAGPEIGQRLELALRRKLDGELAEGSEAELSAAMEDL